MAEENITSVAIILGIEDWQVARVINKKKTPKIIAPSSFRNIDEALVSAANQYNKFKKEKNGPEQDWALDYWRELSLVIIESVSDLELISGIYILAIEDKVAEEILVRKWLNLCKRPEEAAAAHKKFSVGSYYQKLAEERWEKLSLRAIRRTSSIDDLTILYNSALPNGKATTAVIRKIFKLQNK